jgi:hypothetical protein
MLLLWCLCVYMWCSMFFMFTWYACNVIYCILRCSRNIHVMFSYYTCDVLLYFFLCSHNIYVMFYDYLVMFMQYICDVLQCILVIFYGIFSDVHLVYMWYSIVYFRMFEKYPCDILFFLYYVFSYAFALDFIIIYFCYFYLFIMSYYHEFKTRMLFFLEHFSVENGILFYKLRTLSLFNNVLSS